MFERFTDRARRSIVLAQEEARRLQHNYIGTEHVLLGLLSEQRGVAARVAASFGLTLAVGREDLLAIIGRGKQEVTSGHIPFTPRAKKCLELALREALQLGNDYIGTEHVLLGIIREGEGVGAQIILRHAASLGEVRAAVVDLVPSGPVAQQSPGLLRRLTGQRTARVRLQPEPQAVGREPELRTTPAADSSLSAAVRLAGGSPVGSHHILLAALADPSTTAARTLAALGVDLDRAREALRSADVTGSSDELPEDAGRRQMVITVTDDRLTLEAADFEIVQLGRATVDALRASAGMAGSQAQPGATGAAGTTRATASAGKTGATGTAAEGAAGKPAAAPTGGDAVIRGDHPLTASLGLVWQALHDSLEDIRHRAAAEARDAAARASGETAAGEKPATGEEPTTGAARAPGETRPAGESSPAPSEGTAAPPEEGSAT